MFKIYYVLTYPLTLVCLFLIFVYRKLLTHGKGKCCHFFPTCSDYAWKAVREYGVVIGGIMSLKRLCRCRPNVQANVDFPKLNLLGNYKWKC